MKKAKKGKKYTDYNWKELVENSAISDLTVPELNKYLTHHHLQLKRKKNVILDAIKGHFCLHVGDDNVTLNSKQRIYNFKRNETNADGEQIENEQVSDKLSGVEESIKNTLVLNIISDSNSEHSVAHFPGSDAVGRQ